MNIDVKWEITSEDVGCRDCNTCIVISININQETKEIWSVTYSCIWNCVDECCSDTKTDIAYVGQISEKLKRRILEKMPGYNLQGWKWQKAQ